MSKLQKKELTKKMIVIVISIIVSVLSFMEYPQLLYILPMAWIITGIGNMLGYGLIDGLSDHVGRSINQIKSIVNYLSDTYKLWKLL